MRQAVEQFSAQQDRELNSVFFSLPSIGHVVCMMDGVGVGASASGYVTACFDLASFLDPVLQRSSYDWLDIYLYSGDMVSGYRQIYQFSESGRTDTKDPLAEQQGRSIFLPRVVEAGGQPAFSFIYRQAPTPYGDLDGLFAVGVRDVSDFADCDVSDQCFAA